MHTIAVKNIPTDLYERLKKAASANHRSINNEIIACIERAVGVQERNTNEILARARQFREKTARFIITDQEFNRAKSDGRPE